ncbi:MAG: protein-disulfide reductase DsbD [Legionellaceae bacterium]|nr:protein-disulfide reductase DsbD [Legionellaceae bacterium]
METNIHLSRANREKKMVVDVKRILFLISFALCLLYINPSFSEPPPAHSAFKLEVKAHDPNTFVLEWRIKPGYFLYRDRLQLTQEKRDFLELAPLKLPKSTTKVDGLGETVHIYRGKLRIPVSIVGLHSGEDVLNLKYQGCADDGFCYPPEFAAIKLTIDTQLALTHVTLIPPSKFKETKPALPDAPVIDSHFSKHHWLVTLFIFLGLGLLLAFTPCVLPMIPVLSGILVGHGDNLSTRKAFLLSLSYVLSMSFTYAAIGAVVALMGHNLQLLLQSPWAITTFSILFVLLALSMFGAYELRLPTAWQARLAKTSYQQARGHYLGAAIMGCLSTLILSPCVTAPLIGALSYIAQTGNVVLGTAALFFLGLGMGLPLLLVGASLGRVLPKAGDWMNTIKKLFGIMLLAVAVYLMSRLLSAFAVMLLWAGLLIFSGLMLGALKKTSSTLMRFTRGVGILCLVYGILIVIGASAGNTNPLQPLIRSDRHEVAQSHSITVTTMAALETALKQSASQNQPAVLDFYADWCTACKVIESSTLHNTDVLNALQHVQLIKVDLTANNHESRALLHEFNVVAPPTFIFIDATGHERENLRLVGEVAVPVFLNHLQILYGP